MHLYLNDCSETGEPLSGGSTSFHSYDGRAKVEVEPKVGRVLVFQQKDLLHSGDEVLGGLKMTMRSDIMYKTLIPRRQASR
jgi:hypothetical protein